MPVQMFVGGVEIQMRLSGSAAVADGPYSFNSRLALVRTVSPGAIACAGPAICHDSLKNNGGGVVAAAPRPRPSAVRPEVVVGAWANVWPRLASETYTIVAAASRRIMRGLYGAD